MHHLISLNNAESRLMFLHLCLTHMSLQLLSAHSIQNWVTDVYWLAQLFAGWLVGFSSSCCFETESHHAPLLTWDSLRTPVASTSHRSFASN